MPFTAPLGSPLAAAPPRVRARPHAGATYPQRDRLSVHRDSCRPASLSPDPNLSPARQSKGARLLPTCGRMMR